MRAHSLPVRHRGPRSRTSLSAVTAAAGIVLVTACGVPTPSTAPTGATGAATSGAAASTPGIAGSQVGTPAGVVAAKTANQAPLVTGTPSAGATAAVSDAVAAATARIAALLPDLVAIIGTPGSSDGQLMLPFDVAVDAEGNLYVSDSTGVQKLSPSGEFLLRYGAGDLKTALGGLALGSRGEVYVTGFGPSVLAYAPDGTPLPAIGDEGSEAGRLAQPVDVATDADGNLYVADAANGRVEKFAPSGSHLLTIGEPGEGKGQFRNPRSVAVADDGTVFVGQGDDYLVQQFAADGTFLATFGDAHADENVWRVGGIAVDESGNVYLTQTMSSRIQAYSSAPELALMWEMGGLGQGPDQMASPLGVGYRDGRLYVVDQQNNRIKVYEPKP